MDPPRTLRQQQLVFHVQWRDIYLDAAVLYMDHPAGLNTLAN
jgi:hypothetical protein